MNTYEEGDRVVHQTLGLGTVVHPYHGTGYITVRFEDHGAMMVVDSFVKPYTLAFKYGDRVHHRLHGYGKALNSFPSSNLQQVLFDNDTGMEKTLGRLVHPVSLEFIPAPKYTVTVDFLNGTTSTSPELDTQAMRLFTKALAPEDIISYTVRRVLSREERVAFYMRGMDDDPQEQ